MYPGFLLFYGTLKVTTVGDWKTGEAEGRGGLSSCGNVCGHARLPCSQPPPGTPLPLWRAFSILGWQTNGTILEMA